MLKYFSIVLLMSIVPQQALSDNTSISIKCDGTTVHIQNVDRSVDFTMGDLPGDGSIYECQLLSARRQHETVYLLGRFSRPSRPRSPNGFCGAGYEGGLLWLQLTSDLQLVRKDFVLDTSCFQSIDQNTEGPRSDIINGHLEEELINVYRKVAMKIIYEEQHPEKGIQVIEQPWKPRHNN